MAQLLIIWIGTIITSFCMDFSNYFRMYKDVADAGYKIDVIKLTESVKGMNIQKNSVWEIFIPIYNIMKEIDTAFKYNAQRHTLLDQLDVLGALEEMEEYEKEEYLKKPTGFNAFLVTLKSKIRLQNADKLEINNENGKSEIFYEIGEKDGQDDIIILKVTGPASKLTKEEQKKEVAKFLPSLFEVILKEYGVFNENELDEIIGTVFEGYQIEKDNDIKENKTISERKQELENLKNELLETKENQQKKSNNPVYINRKK